jgi:nicotinamidase-related amidase
MKPALLVIDVQKAFFEDETAARSLNRAIETINPAIDLFRRNKLPIICIQHMDPEDNLVPGQMGFDLPDSLNILPEDLRFHKTYGNAFNKTSLAAHIKDLGVDALIITGYCAEFCVLSTCRGAEDVDLMPIVLLDSLASGTEKNIHFVERIQESVSLGALSRLLGE